LSGDNAVAHKRAYFVFECVRTATVARETQAAAGICIRSEILAGEVSKSAPETATEFVTENMGALGLLIRTATRHSCA
jgi:hypothetical protein